MHDDGASPANFRLRLEPLGADLEAARDETLVEAALRAGIELDTSCRNGTCRTCMAMLESGTVAYRIEWPGLLAEEKAEGWVLPCVAYPRSDLVLRVAHQ